MKKKMLLTILIVSILGNFIGLYFAYKFVYLRRQNGQLNSNLKDASEVISSLTDISEKDAAYRLAFLHHSVGKGILEEGKLKDSLSKIGVAVKDITYGDSIGEFTDMRD